MSDRVICAYTCDCLREEVTFEVNARLDKQSFEDWMKVTMTKTLAADHNERSPLCMTKRVKNLRIPGTSVEDAGKAGTTLSAKEG